MLNSVKLKPKKFADYKEVISEELYHEVVNLAKNFKGRRILHINATSKGGGVAEILYSMVPLLQDLGLAAQWRVIDADQKFFTMTKKIHNSLQGFDENLTSLDWDFYESVNQELASELDLSQWDTIVTHDPQPTAIIEYADRSACQWVWRCHLDASEPIPAARDRFSRYLGHYNGAIFTLSDYIFTDFGDCKVGIIPVAIDPLSAKNRPMGKPEARSIVKQFGIDPARPFMVQVSRFDPWKDPEGVITAWQLAKRKVPDLQLALVGNTADDDPQSKDILADVRKLDREDDDFCVLADEADDRTVKAFFTAANVVIQKSIREGFGLTVTEALWSAAPIVATKVGGIPLQVQNGVTGYLVDGVVEAAEKIVELVKNPALAARMGQAGQEHVRGHFLLPRMIYDHLTFLASLQD